MYPTVCKNDCEYPQCIFRHIEKLVHHLKMPNKQWIHVTKVDSYILFRRIEDDLSTYLGVSVDLELNVKIYKNTNIVDWIEFQKPRKLSDVEQILQIVNESFDSSQLFSTDNEIN